VQESLEFPGICSNLGSKKKGFLQEPLEKAGQTAKAVILLDRTQIHKFTKETLGTISIGRCLLYFHCFLGDFVGASTTQMRKHANVQIAVPA
jgi:hypothetical protein